MSKIMEIIARETNGKSYNTEKYSYDSVGVPSFDYDDSADRVMKWKASAETEVHKRAVSLVAIVSDINGQTPLFTYFLDGSRHVYKVDDISYNKKVYPVVAGQIGVGCCKRVNKQMEPERFYRRLVIALPKVSYQDGWGEEAFLLRMLRRLMRAPNLNDLAFHLTEF